MPPQETHARFKCGVDKPHMPGADVALSAVAVGTCDRLCKVNLPRDGVRAKPGGGEFHDVPCGIIR